MDKKFPYKSILVACSVNTARSPMAFAYLENFFNKHNIKVELASGGISSHARDGMLISMDAKLAMREIGIELSDTSVSVDLKKHPELIERADLILTLTEKHKREIYEFINHDNKVVFTLREFAGESGDINDPSMKELEGFRKARNEIIDCLKRGLNNYVF